MGDIGDYQDPDLTPCGCPHLPNWYATFLNETQTYIEDKYNKHNCNI